MLRPVEVTAPDGTRWTVGRALMPWRPKRRIGGSDTNVWDVPGGPSFGDFAGDDPLSAILGLIAIGVFLVALVLLAGPILGLLVLGLEWFLVLVLGILGAGLRALLGRPFRVFAVSARDRYQVDITGWRLSGRVADELVERIRTTGRPPGSASV